MPVLLIQNASGETEIRDLSKHVPLAIGRHASNDVRIPEPAVAVLHCRVSWNSKGYEVVAGTDDGVDVNGQLVPNAILTLGDCIQVGSVGLFYYDRRDQAEAALRGEEIPEAAPSAASKRETLRTAPQHEAASQTPVRQRAVRPPTPPRAAPPPPARPAPPPPPDSLDDILVAPEPPQKPLAAAQGLFASAPVRPGEQDVMRSPLVLTLGIGTIVLVMMSFALWFVIGRDASQKAFQLAQSELEQKRFTQAITQFEEFLKTYPDHQLTSAARHSLGLARIEQPIAGAAPAWDRGVAEIEKFITEHRRDKTFAEVVPQVLELAERIAKGSAEAAGVQKKPELLKISATATRLLQQHSPLDKPPKQALAEIEAAVQKAEATIRKHDTFQKALAQIDQNLKASQPFAAFDTRRKLLLKYPDLETDKALATRLQQAVDAERKLTVRKAVDQAAKTTETPPVVAWPSLNLLRQTRTRADTLSAGLSVFTVAQETCFAADSMTGVLQWRRVIGLDTPFPPLPVSLDVLGLLLFDTRVNELILVRQRDGGLIWRHPLPAAATAAPLVHAGQVFIPTRDGNLCQLDLVTGRMTSQLHFSQPLATSPLLIAKSDRLLVAGSRAVVYTLKYRPLECVAVTYTGHSPGAIQAPLMKMGEFLLTAENDRQDSALLRVWNTSVGDKPLTRLTSARIPGQVREPAMMRGKQLVVPSSPERLSAFTVSDEQGDKVLAAAGTYQAEHPRGGPIYVTLGSDEELWMTSSTLRRLQIGPDSILPQKGELGLGVSTQPVQVIDQLFYATSKIPSNSATYFLAADRQQMISQWLSVLAGRALVAAAMPSTDGSVPLLIDSGDVFSVMPAKLKAGGIDNRPVTTLTLPPGLTTPLGAALLSNGRLAAWCGGPQAKLWQLNADGIVAHESKLPEPLEAAPILLSDGVLLPLPGKLRLIESPEFKGAVEDLMPPVNPKQPARWKGVLRLDAKQAIAVNDQGRVLRAQVRSEPVPHVAEVAALELKVAVERPPVLIGNRLFVTTGKVLRGLDVGTLEARGEIALPEVVSQGPWVLDNLLVMVCGRDQLVAVTGDPVAVAWKQKIPQGTLAGAPQLRTGQLLIATQSGEVALRNLTNGDLIRKASTGQPLVLGPLAVQDLFYVATLDGSLLLLNPWLETQP